MTTRPVPNSITLADLAGLPPFKVLVEAPYAALRDEQLALFSQYLPAWNANVDEPLYKSVELFATVLFMAQEHYNGQVGLLDPRNWDDNTAQLVGALFGVLKKDGEGLDPYISRILSRQVAQDDTGTYIGLRATMLNYPDLNIVSAHASVEPTNRDVINCYALKLTEAGLKRPLTDDERAAFGTYTPPQRGGQPSTDGYLNADDRADFGKFYRVQPLARVDYTVALKIFYDDTLHTQERLDTIVRDTVIKWAFDQDQIGEELRPRLLEALLIEGEEGIHDASAAFTTNPVIAPDADGVYPAADDRHYKGPCPECHTSAITLTWEQI